MSAVGIEQRTKARAEPAQGQSGPWRITFDTNPGRLQPPLHHVRGPFALQHDSE